MFYKILELIKAKVWKDVRDEITHLSPVNIAELFDHLKENDMIILFRIMPKDLAAEVFSYLSGVEQKIIVKAITDKELEYIINELFFDDMIDFLEEMPSNFVKEILKSTKKDRRKLINQF